MSSIRGAEMYSKDSIVFIETGNEKAAVMDRIIDVSGFLVNVGAALERSGKRKEEFSIVVKAAFMAGSTREGRAELITDPDLVERLIHLLNENGFRNITIIESKESAGNVLAGGSVKKVAAELRYSANGYRIADIADDWKSFKYTGMRREYFIGKEWRDADYRISFGKNRTDRQCFYSGAMRNVFPCFSGSVDTDHALAMLERFPVHFGFLDAWVSGDGSAGSLFDSHANKTKTLMASANIVALDWVTGEKMDINPSFNDDVQSAVQRWGTFHIVRKGNMSPWDPWKNVPLVSVAFSQLMKKRAG
jgi:uncharacterized protein (DUF362 family)